MTKIEDVKVDTKLIFLVSKEDMRKVGIQEFLLKKEKDEKRVMQ